MSKQKKLESAGKEAFIDAVLSLPDEGTGLREINLRKAARRVGCAHTNAYDYFTSYEELLWWSLRGALEQLTAPVNPDKDDLVEAYVDFALKHPAWYRLIWVEPLTGDPPPEVAAFLPVPSRQYTRWLERISGALSGEDLELRGRILHAYLHGELAAITAGRVPGDREEMKKRVMSGASLLFRLLFGQT